MSSFSRRSFVIGAGAAASLTAACGNGVGSNGANEIDARTSSTLSYLYENYPGARDLAGKSSGQLVMPLVTEAAFWVGGAYGRGALLINDVTVDYYSSTQASFGFQAGAQQYAHVLFFMTETALADFRHSPGWAAGADVSYAISDKGGNLNVDTTTASSPVIALIFGQAGLLAGASIEGTKYSRIIP